MPDLPTDPIPMPEPTPTPLDDDLQPVELSMLALLHGTCNFPIDPSVLHIQYKLLQGIRHRPCHK